MAEDMNKMDHAGSVEEGCETGKHDFDMTELWTKDGETQIGGRCRNCKKVQVYDVDLGVKDLVISDEEIAEFSKQQQEAAQKIGADAGAVPPAAIIANQKAQRAKDADSFWDKVKHGE